MPKRQQAGVLALYPFEDTFATALRAVMNTQGFTGAVPYTPASYHGLMAVAHDLYGASPVRWLTLVGGLVGCTTGLLMPILMDYDWPLVVGGKTAGLYSLPVVVIFMFEFFILLGAIATILGMLWFGKLANPRAQVLDERLTDDMFGLFVPGLHAGSPQVAQLKQLGATEIRAIKGQ